MLILTRKPGESIFIGDIKVTIVEIKGHQIRVGIDAPPEVRIYREEIYVQILEENRKAAQAAMVSESGLEGLPQSWHKEGEDDAAKRRSKLSSGKLQPSKPQASAMGKLGSNPVNVSPPQKATTEQKDVKGDFVVKKKKRSITDE